MEPTEVKQLSDAAFYGRLLGLPTNLRLGWKSLAGSTTLAFYENSQIKAVKSYHIGPWACIIKRITAVIYGFRNKLECLFLASLSSLF
jgi:hypothetical protein